MCHPDSSYSQWGQRVSLNACSSSSVRRIQRRATRDDRSQRFRSFDARLRTHPALILGSAGCSRGVNLWILVSVLQNSFVLAFGGCSISSSLHEIKEYEVMNSPESLSIGLQIVSQHIWSCLPRHWSVGKNEQSSVSGLIKSSLQQASPQNGRKTHLRCTLRDDDRWD